MKQQKNQTKMQYKNIHDYLDSVLFCIEHPTKTQIIEAKRQYHKLWHKQYNRKRRATRKEFTLGFTPKILQQIRAKKGTQGISEYLYHTIYKALETYGSASNYDNELLIEIKRQLMQIISLLEEVLELNSQQNYEILLTQMEALGNTMHKLLV